VPLRNARRLDDALSEQDVLRRLRRLFGRINKDMNDKQTIGEACAVKELGRQ